MPLDHTLGLGVPGSEHDYLHPERPPESLKGIREVGLSAVTRDQGAFVVIDTRSRHRPESQETGQVPGQDVVGLTARDHLAHHHPGVAAEPHDHRGMSHLAGFQGHVVRREPQVPLGQLAGKVGGPARRIGWQEQRSQLTHSLLQDRERPCPADALGDHRGRHPRCRHQQATDLRLEGVDRTSPWTHVDRPGGSFDRSAVRTVLATPIWRAISLIDRPSDLDSRRISAQSSTPNTSSSPARSGARVLGSNGGSAKGGQDSGVDKGSVFKRRRQRGTHTRS